jgi:SSS family solute:Na+ symporter
MMTTIQIGGEAKEVLRSDRAYPVLLNLLPTGLKGLSFAALTAAIVASLAGKANSISTIFTLDLYKKYFNKNASERHLVNVGKVAIIGAMLIAIVMAPQLSRFDQAFQFIQDFTGLISPGVVAIFILGMFWKRANGLAALVAALATLPLGIGFNEWMPSIPFLHRMGYVFLILVALMVIVSLVSPQKETQAGIEVDSTMFRFGKRFGVGMLLVLGIIAALYTVFW